MTTLHCTRDARDFLGVSVKDMAKPSDADATVWFVHAVTIDRRKCLLFTHWASIYSFWIAPVRKAMVADLHSLFLDHLLRTLRMDDFDDDTIDRLATGEAFQFATTNDRSTVSSMNAHVLDSRHY